uniref:Putative secreted protein n=1 Tax=Anopheles darlingi TaxID=43151 RepID=A0A2M4DJL7_ANODA
MVVVVVVVVAVALASWKTFSICARWRSCNPPTIKRSSDWQVRIGIPPTLRKSPRNSEFRNSKSTFRTPSPTAPRNS